MRSPQGSSSYYTEICNFQCHKNNINALPAGGQISCKLSATIPESASSLNCYGKLQEKDH